MKLAIIGAGQRGMIYAHYAYEKCNAEIVAVVDISEKKREAAAEKFNIPANMQFTNVEDFYKQALAKLDNALADKDSLDAGVATSALQQQALIKAALVGIYKNLDAGAEYVQEFRTRADAIKPLIEDLLNNQDNETKDNDEEDD